MKKCVVFVTVAVFVFVGALADGFADRVVRGQSAKPVSIVTNAAGNILVDFGRHQTGWIEVDAVKNGEYEFVWGELLNGSGSVETNSFFTHKQGCIRCAHTKDVLDAKGWTRIPYHAAKEKRRNTFRPEPVGRFGTVMPFRWLEVVKAPFPVTEGNVRQVPIYYPYDMSESSFDCDSMELVRVYDFCKHSIRATTYMGKFIDGDRERLPYEADSYITQLGTYAITSDQTLVRAMADYFATHTTWPTEWKQFFIRIVYEDWMHSGNTELIRKHYSLMRDVKSWRSLRRADGLLVTPSENMTNSVDGKIRDIVDWAKCYRDGFVFTPVNAVVNALHYRNLKEMSEMARAIGKIEDAAMFEKESALTFESYQRTFFDSAARRYRDGIGTDHATVQGNAMALACGVVPSENIASVAQYIAKKGFTCSTYMAQFVLESLFIAGRADDAFRLMTSSEHRSWLGMMAKGATVTMEFWDLTLEEPARIPDMNHSWSTAPLNMISRWVMGVKPLKPGFEEISIRPNLGPLKCISGTVPTPKGPVRLKMAKDGDVWSVELETPAPVQFGFGGNVLSLQIGKYNFVNR